MEKLNKLSLFEKIALNRQARKDVARENFREILVEKEAPQTNVAGQNFRGILVEKEAPQTNVADDRPVTEVGLPRKGSADNNICISPFINAELGAYETQRDYYLGARKNFVRIFNEKKKKEAFYNTFPAIIGEFDRVINIYKAELKLMFTDYGEMLNDLRLDKQKYEKLEAPEYVELCSLKAKDLRRKVFKEAKQLYRILIDLLNKKGALLNTTEAKLRAIRSKRFLRVNYYYQNACERSTMTVINLSDELLCKIGNMDIMERYSDIKNDVARDLEKLNREFELLQQKKI